MDSKTKRMMRITNKAEARDEMERLDEEIHRHQVDLSARFVKDFEEFYIAEESAHLS
jgi:hypothetical protein